MNKIMVLSLLVILVLAVRTEAMNPDPADFALDSTGTITWLIQPGPNMNVARMGQNSASLGRHIRVCTGFMVRTVNPCAPYDSRPLCSRCRLDRIHS